MKFSLKLAIPCLIAVAALLFAISIPMPAVTHAQIAEQTSTPGGPPIHYDDGNGCPDGCWHPEPTAVNPYEGHPSLCALVTLNIRAEADIHSEVLTKVAKHHCVTYADGVELPNPRPQWLKVVFWETGKTLVGYIAAYNPKNPAISYIDEVPN